MAACGTPNPLKAPAGVSLEKKAPHWQVWQKNLRQALSKGKIWGSEQIAMNITIYVDELPVEILPAYCNWTLINKLKYF